MKRLHHLIIPFIILVTLLGVSPAQPAGAAGNYSLRFYGNGSGGIDRVRIPIDPHVPANVGGDFTIEFWMKAAAADNTSGTCTPGGVNWINGNVIIDRDVYGDGDHGDYGISLYGGKIAFGVARGSNSQTICSSASVADNVWHHIAVTRNATSGAMRIFVDGVLSASGTGPTGDVSYRAGRSTSYPDSDPYLVFGAEKHDAGPGYPSYNGYLDEVRISNNVRYTVDFYRPAAPLTADGNTVALYRFDEGPAGNCEGAIGDVLGTSNGSCEFGGSPAGPVYSADTPPIYQPDLIITGYQLLNEAKTEVITEVGPNQGFWIRFQIRNRGGGASGLFYPGVFLDGKPNYGPDHEVFGRVTSFSDFRISPPGTLGFQEGCLYYDPAGTIDPLTQLISPERGNYTRSSYNSELAPGATANVDVYIGYPASEPEYSGSEYDNIRTGLPPGNYNIHLYVDPNCSGGEVESNEYNNHFGPITLSIEDEGGACTPPTGGPQVFADVPASHWAKDYIEAMYHCGLTAGCGTSPLIFCPERNMNRVESAVFILRGNFGSAYNPPPPPWGTFADNWSAGAWGEKWAEGLYREGLTAGCATGPLRFCPWDLTPRVQLAVFSLRLKHGNSYNPPPATGTVFADLTNVNFYGTKWAEQAYLEGLIPACGTQGGKPMFCPDNLVSRALAAYSIIKAKGILP